jgi:2-polyprenyl-6-methoxyphenol hydroxylase-like FAD-dependent oxidoreductase
MDEALTTRCCIVGGGPAGMMCGFLLARAGVPVIVLEKHADFFRDFRGDTIHPSTLEIIHELGLSDAFLQRPHQELRTISAQIGEETLQLADLTALPTHSKFLAIMPQWDFLDFIAEHARKLPSFRLMMQTEAVDLIRNGSQTAGVVAKTQSGTLAIRADLVVSADGRHSTIRGKAGFSSVNLGAPMDVLWFRLSRKKDDPTTTLGRINDGRMMVLIDRADYWQCAFLIRKGGYDELRDRGLAEFRSAVVALIPHLRDRVGELRSWDDVKLLTVVVDRLKRWHAPGLLCIGDAAHAMSPVGGVGINLAIQDAVAAANILAPIFRNGPASEHDLARVQRRRELPTRLMQGLQVQIQNRIITRVLGGAKPGPLPWPLRILRSSVALRRLLGRVIGLGFRPEHVQLPAG